MNICIETESYFESLKSIFQQFPFLKESKQVHMFMLICIESFALLYNVEETRKKWKEVAPCIISLSHLESRNRNVRSALEIMKNFEGIMYTLS